MISSVLLSTVSVLNILCLLTSWSSCQSVPRLVRGRAHAVCVVGLPVGVEVAAEAVVSHTHEFAEEFFSIYHEAARDQRVRLLIVGEKCPPVLHLGS